MTLTLDLQIASRAKDIPARADFLRWAGAALAGRRKKTALTVRVVGAPESRGLNATYRGKDRPTNVLSFPFQAPPGIEPPPLLGDLVICASVVNREARSQGKAAEAHWAHMVVHGVLHLLGYDHRDDEEAAVMEGLEKRVLAGLHFPDPYDSD